MNNIDYDILELTQYGNSLKGSEVYFRDDWGCYYFSLLGKCFGMLNDDRITLKNDPIENIALREKYVSITPGYYANKKHWNSIDLKVREFGLEDMKMFIFKSYELVLNGLTKKEKLIIDEMHIDE